MAPSPSDLLREVGPLLYGEEWQSPLARELNVNVRTMQRWVAGEMGPRDPGGVAARLLLLMEERGQALAASAKRLRRDLERKER